MAPRASWQPGRPPCPRQRANRNAERWPSGRRRTPGKCVYGNPVSWVRIPPAPPPFKYFLLNDFRPSSRAVGISAERRVAAVTPTGCVPHRLASMIGGTRKFNRTTRDIQEPLSCSSRAMVTMSVAPSARRVYQSNARIRSRTRPPSAVAGIADLPLAWMSRNARPLRLSRTLEVRTMLARFVAS